jgi:hypothetical protein
MVVECRSIYMIHMRKPGWREKRRRLTERDAGDVGGSIDLGCGDGLVGRGS